MTTTSGGNVDNAANLKLGIHFDHHGTIVVFRDNQEMKRFDFLTVRYSPTRRGHYYLCGIVRPEGVHIMKAFKFFSDASNYYQGDMKNEVPSRV